MDGDIRVVIIDDQAMVRAGFGALLNAQDGIEVVGDAADGVEAVARARTFEPDVVLMDIMMPEMNGHEALGALREARPDLPVVFFSGFDGNEVAEHLAQASAYTSFMPKPFDNEELLAEIRRAIESRD